MGTIFERATCTIVAVDAIDDDTNQDIGLFNLRHADPLAVRMSCLFVEGLDDPRPPDDQFWDGKPERLSSCFPPLGNRNIILRPRWKGLWHTILESNGMTESGPFKNEFFRIIYYTKRKIFWECQKISNNEENRPNTVPSLRSQFALQLV